ncbi:hypothetical protein MKY96_21425 [Paenibacillus sp. FSL R7-0302]
MPKLFEKDEQLEMPTMISEGQMVREYCTGKIENMTEQDFIHE